MATSQLEAQSPTPLAAAPSRRRPGAVGVLALAAWFGLAAGLMEVSTKVVCAAIGIHGGLYRMSRHFVWLVPLANLLIFLVVGAFLALLVRVAPRFGRWLSVRWLGALALLPSLMIVFPEIYAWAWFLLAFGVASRCAAGLAGRGDRLRRVAAISFPVMAIVTAGLAAWVFGGDWVKSRREVARAFPPAGTPNVLLVVMDTVRADRLSAYGYPRDTSPSLEYLATQSVRFDAVRSASPWTLPSHGSMFTGRLPRELKADWMTPLDMRFPTLAGYLGSRGYATAGFVGNTFYCAYDTGLSKGFTHYEDYKLQQMDALLVSQLATGALTGFFQLSAWGRARWGPEATAPLERFVRDHVYSGKRKDAATVNRDFLHWLSSRDEHSRPFFAFLNYTDAHDPYLPPKPSDFRFGLRPTRPDDFLALENWVSLDKRGLHPRYTTLASDAYDDCLRSIDDQIASLFSNLSRRGLMDRTLVIVTADHGESFGEHGLYSHGNSLYTPEVHVPLFVRLPARRPARSVVGEVVSLRDLPATIVDLVRLGDGSPFPGRSLARTWDGSDPDPESRGPAAPLAVSELSAPNPWGLGRQAPSPAEVGPLIGLTSSRYSFLWNQKTAELFDLAADPGERTNLAEKPSMKPVVEQFQGEIRRILRK